ncbi:MAG: hypothetical protein WKF77_27985 [Planctomycetaceae bacterium]
MRVRIDQRRDQDHRKNVTGVRRQLSDHCNTTVLFDNLDVFERRLIWIQQPANTQNSFASAVRLPVVFP